MIATAVLYAILAWVAWPSLGFQAIGLGAEASIDALRHMSFGNALTHVGEGWWRPGESSMFWLIAHGPSLLPWRMAMLVILLLTTAYLQYDCTVRARSSLDGFGAAVAFSLNPTTLSVLCWLSAANISLCAVGLLAYVAFARRALETNGSPVRDAVLATLALMFALAFYELALFAPLLVLGYHWLLAPHPQRAAKRYLYGGSALCVLAYLLLQAQLADLPQFWAAGPTPFELAASSMRYVVQNFYLWFNPFETFGVLIPEQPGGHTLENLFGFAIVGAGLGLTWYFRKRDPLTALSGLWFLIFLAPVGTFLHFEGSPVAEQHLYIPMLGVALGGTRLFTRTLEGAIVRIRNKPARVAFEITFSVFLLWSLAPLVAECKRTVEHWGDSRELFLTTLQNYPTSTGALDHLTAELSVHTPQLVASQQQKPEWKQIVDGLLLCPRPRPASELLSEGRTLLSEERYADASSALARAFATSATPREQLDAGKGLVQALSHTSLRDRAPALLQRLRHDHPAELDEF